MRIELSYDEWTLIVDAITTYSEHLVDDPEEVLLCEGLVERLNAARVSANANN